jgi:hypothetical protein
MKAHGETCIVHPRTADVVRRLSCPSCRRCVSLRRTGVSRCPENFIKWVVGHSFQPTIAKTLVRLVWELR